MPSRQTATRSTSFVPGVDMLWSVDADPSDVDSAVLRSISARCSKKPATT